MNSDDWGRAYALLGLKQGCGGATVRWRFRQLVLQCNPALDPTDSRRGARLESLLRAYQALLERETTRELAAQAPKEDELWKPWRASGEVPRVSARRPAAKPFPAADPPGRRSSIKLVVPAERPPLVFPVDLTFEEAALGTTLEFGLADGTLSIEIPPGTDHGALFSLQLRGADGAAVVTYIEIRVAVHPIYRRVGTTLYIRAAVSEARALEGGTLCVPIPGEVIEVRVERYSRHGTAIRVAGKGMHSPQGRGDLIVELAESSKALR
jgi:hypothetical protein